MSKVTFDYSKAGCFIADHEVEAMKPLEMISLAGSTFRLIMIKKNLPVLKQQLRRFRKIQRFFL